MDTDLLAALAMYAFVTSITPGPNNFMLLASGANFGVVRTMPHMLGVVLGFSILAITVGVGLLEVFDAVPYSYTVLKVVSILYMLYLAWKIAKAAPTLAEPEPQDASASATDQTLAPRPMTFVQAALFQWINPKAIAMALTCVTVYAPDKSLVSIMLAVAVFTLVNAPCVGVWVVAGVQLRRWLSDPVHLRRFNWLMAALLIASLVPVLV